MAKKKEVHKPEMPQITQTPWGHELLIASNDLYVVKQLFIKAGKRLSLQVHEERFEHITLVSGGAQMYMETTQGLTNFLMSPMTPVEVAPGTMHRISALDEEDAVLVEVSTNHPDDIIRIDDDYGRADNLDAEQEGNYGIDDIDGNND